MCANGRSIGFDVMEFCFSIDGGAIGANGLIVIPSRYANSYTEALSIFHNEIGEGIYSYVFLRVAIDPYIYVYPNNTKILKEFNRIVYDQMVLATQELDSL